MKSSKELHQLTSILFLFVLFLFLGIPLICAFAEQSLIGTIAIISLIIIFIYFDYNPFKDHPIFEEYLDISGKRQPHIEDLIDKYLIEEGIDDIEEYNSVTSQWIEENEKKLSKYKLFSNHREKQFINARKVASKYTFIIYRNQTRYSQANYIRKAYNVEQEVNKCVLSYAQLITKFNDLAEIDFECTMRQYNSKNQRKLMTKQLRKMVMERDNYTCQCCGKYMPDEVGLQIDHIIPINKGGKTILSNLQVLCSKCNGRKSDKL